MAFTRTGTVSHDSLSGVSVADHHAEIAIADQAAMEAETNEDTAVPPDLVRHSPGVAKVWVKWEQAGAHSILASFNMSSVTDGGLVGDTDHLFDVDFSSAEYVLVGEGEEQGSSGTLIVPQAATYLAGGLTTHTVRANDTTNLDLNHNAMVVLGDQ